MRRTYETLRDPHSVGPAVCLDSWPTAAQQPGWWRDRELQQELALSASQISAVEQVFQATLDERRVLRRELDQAQAALNRALFDGTVTDEEAAALISRLVRAEARRNTARTMMLFHMYRHLTPAQRQRLAQVAGTPRPDRR